MPWGAGKPLERGQEENTSEALGKETIILKTVGLLVDLQEMCSRPVCRNTQQVVADTGANALAAKQNQTNNQRKTDQN